MNTPRRLARPPITEALIDARVDGAKPITPDLIAVLASRISDYPHKVDQRRFETKVGVGEGPHPEAVTQDLGLHGVMFRTEDGKVAAQFQGDGFTLNRLQPYTSWEGIFPEAMRLWAEYVRAFQPTRVRRLAVRYINHIQLPGGELRLQDFLTSPIAVPQGLPTQLTSFLTSVVLHDRETGCHARITQSLGPPPETLAGPVLRLDIDAYQPGDWPPSEEAVTPVLRDLRALKNKVFFSTLTEAALARFE